VTARHVMRIYDEIMAEVGGGHAREA
jgi:hypothetical protein